MLRLLCNRSILSNPVLLVRRDSSKSKRLISSLVQVSFITRKCSQAHLNLLRKPFLRWNSVKQITKENINNKKSADIWRLLSLAKPERLKIGGAVVLLLVFSSISMSMPYFIGKIIDIMYTSNDDHDKMLETLRKLCYALAGLFVVGAAANVGRLYMIQTAGQNIIKRLRQRTFGSIISQEVAFFDKTSSGELVNRLSSDTSLVGKAVTDNVSDGLRSTVQAIGGISLMVYTSPKLASVSLLVVPPVVLFAIIYGRYVRKITKQVQDKLADSSQVAEERFSNMRTVRAFAQEYREMDQYNHSINQVYELSKKEALARAAFFGFNTLSGNIIALTVLYNGGVMMRDSLITVGDLTSFLIYTVYVGISIAGLGSFYTELMKGIGASSRIWQFIDKTPEIPLKGGVNINYVVANNSLEFKNLRFAYPLRADNEILSNFNLSVPSGSVTAIVGESGSGKSTIGSLLLRYYDVNDGTIKIGGTNSHEFDPMSLRQYIGTVSQEPILFSNTIAENISYGVKEAPFEDIVNAAKQANAYNFIQNFTHGFDTMVGERGQMLSGGQRQRIALARAILKDPKILLLDEATSALDAESEHLVQDALQTLMKGRTTVIIAHRLSTIKTANQIAVLQNGSIAEIGTYSHLLKKENGIFRQLVERQSFGET